MFDGVDWGLGVSAISPTSSLNMPSARNKNRKSAIDAPAEQALFHHISVLRETPRTPEDRQLRLATIVELSGLADDLGPVKTRDKLIPQIAKGTNFSLSEFMAVAELLNSLKSKVGGPTHMYLLLPYLECLLGTLNSQEVLQLVASTLEEIVSEITINSLNQLVHIVVPLIERISTHDSDAARSSGCALLPIVYFKLSTDRKIRLERRFAFLCTDQAVTVRSAAVEALPRFVEALFQAEDNETALALLLPQLLTLARDSETDVRLLAAEALEQTLCSMLKIDAVEKFKLLFCLRDCTRDEDHRVRHAYVAKLCKWQSFFGADHLYKVFLPAYQRSLRDENADVRIEGVRSFKDFCSALPMDGRQENIRTYLIPCIKVLVNDFDPKVKKSLSDAVHKLLQFNEGSVEAEIVSLLKVEVPELWMDRVFDEITDGNVVDATLVEHSATKKTHQCRSAPSSNLDLASLHLELDGRKDDTKVTNIFNLNFQQAVNPSLNLNVFKNINVKASRGKRNLNPCRHPVEKSLHRLYPDPEHRMRISASDSTKKGYESITADKRKEVEDDLADFLGENYTDVAFPSAVQLTLLINNILADERRKL